MGETISVVIPTFDDIQMARISVTHALIWADEVVVLDSSTDETVVMLSFLADCSPKLKLHPIAEADVLEFGLAWLRNEGAKRCTKEWVLSMDDDMVVDNPIDLFKAVEANQSADVLEVRRITIKPRPADSLAAWERSASHAKETLNEQKHILYRPNRAAMYQGYIHEELNGGESVVSIPIDIWHLSWLRNENRKRYAEIRNSYLLSKVVANPILQDGVNPHWFTDFYWQNLDRIQADAAEYRLLTGRA